MSKRTVLLSTLILLFIAVSAAAAPATARQAQTMVQGWLKTDMQPLGAALGRGVLNVETFSDDNAQPVYYVVYLQPSGFIIVPADDMVEPIIGFADDGTYDPSSDNPLGALVSNDLPNRIAAARNLQTAQAQAQSLNEQQRIFQKLSAEAQTKWSDLLAMDGTPTLLGMSSISDVWVAPLTASTWGQTTVCGLTCYNYYTPGNYACGCVATAMAQLLRYHQQPATYTWSNMPLQPDCNITLTQRQAIGALCYDAAESIDTVYDPGGTWAYIWKVREALPYQFGYDNAIHAWNNNNDIGSGLINIVNPNLDADHPVILGIYQTGSGMGHAVLADGYGYNYSTLYHHINMGWDGYDDAWYNLPNVDCSYPGPFNNVTECIYNVFFNESGEIISGRVTDELSGEGISGAEVTALRSGGGTYNATTNSNGIYALWGIPSASTYTVSVTKDGYTFTPSSEGVSTGTSTHQQAVSGNRWGIDFEGSGSSPDAYCSASGSCDEYISEVEIGDIDNTSDCSGYANYTGISTQISGTSHIKVYNGNGYSSDKCGIWIDWNQDKIFDHPGELVLDSSGTGPYESDITVPVDANDGYTRMRIRIQYSGTLNPCGETSYGEVEDYNLIVIPDGDCNIVTIGTGSTEWTYPMHTYFHDSRTQVIYLANEIGPAGIITTLALDVATLPDITMNNWTIRMKHTALSSYSTYNLQNTGWTTVYQKDETVGSTGWITFDFDTPFVYNGSDNLLIDFSHNNNDYLNNGQCNASNSEATRSLYAYSDSGYGDPLDWSGSSNPTVTGSNYIPNLKLTICRDNEAPQLSDGMVSPDSGEPDIDFYYYVNYYDPDNDTPAVKDVYINDTPYAMTLVSGTDSNGTYEYGPVSLSAGTHSYYFYFEDGAGGTARLPVSSSYTGPTVGQAGHKLTVTSSNPGSGVLITVTPSDSNADSNGITPFTRTYDHNTVVMLSAPLTADGNSFKQWQLNSVDSSNTLDVVVTMDANYTLTAQYEQILFSPMTIDLNRDGMPDFTDFSDFALSWADGLCQPPSWCQGRDFDHNGTVDKNDLQIFSEFWLWPVADIDLDSEVNFIDYAMLCDLWGQTACEFPDFCNGCDLDKSDVVDMNDLSQMTEYWLFGD